MSVQDKALDGLEKLVGGMEAVFKTQTSGGWRIEEAIDNDSGETVYMISDGVHKYETRSQKDVEWFLEHVP